MCNLTFSLILLSLFTIGCYGYIDLYKCNDVEFSNTYVSKFYTITSHANVTRLYKKAYLLSIVHNQIRPIINSECEAFNDKMFNIKTDDGYICNDLLSVCRLGNSYMIKLFNSEINDAGDRTLNGYSQPHTGSQDIDYTTDNRFVYVSVVSIIILVISTLFNIYMFISFIHAK